MEKDILLHIKPGDKDYVKRLKKKKVEDDYQTIDIDEKLEFLTLIRRKDRKYFFLKRKRLLDRIYYDSVKEIDISLFIEGLKSVEKIMINECSYKDRFICYNDVFLYQEEEGGPFYIAYTYEKAEGKSLLDYWEQHYYNIQNVDFALWLLITYRLFTSLDILHSNKIYHRDIKPDNIIYNDKGTVENFLKLIDFDFSCSKNCSSSPGTAAYFSEDVFGKDNGKTNWEKMDIKSALITVLKLYLFPYRNLDDSFYIQKSRDEYLINEKLIKEKYHERNITNNLQKQILENLINIFLLDAKSPDLNAKYIIKMLNNYAGKCIPKQIKYNV
jgi:serine/threonine protein kinase